VYFELESLPLPKAIDERQASAGDLITGTMFVMYASIFALAFVPAIAASQAAAERESGSKHQQIIAGVLPHIYWLSYFVVDFGIFLITWVISILAVVGAPVKEFTTGTDKFAYALLVLLFGIAAIPLGYILSQRVAKAKSAMTSTLGLFMGLGFVLWLGTLVLTLIGEFSNSLRGLADVAKVLTYIFNVHPTHAVGRGLFMILLQRSRESGIVDLPGFTRGATFAWNTAGMSVLYLVIECIVFPILLLKWADRAPRPAAAASTSVGHSNGEDDDVVAERMRVGRNRDAASRIESGQGAVRDMIEVDEVDKVYGSPGSPQSVHAVNHISFGVPPGQCFGLLGHNGAGKSSLMSIMAGVQQPSTGTVRIDGSDIGTQRADALHSMGYAPQTNPLIDLMTCREHLTLYATLHGFEPSDVPRSVSSMLSRADLDDHADKLSMNLSGGNKRKLVLACALISEPQVLISDEISSGVDPAARRKLVQTVKEFLVGRSVVLSTHILEEAEMLCTKLCIMVDGVMRCIGTRETLTNKFGEGYLLEISAPLDRRDQVVAFVTDTLPGSRLVESHGKLMRFQTSKAEIKLYEIFAVLERAKAGLGILEYSIAQPTLEQVFIMLTKESKRAAAGTV
jgi:ATP-binding cassette subfamily A (ABC1) protein 1